MAGGKKETQFFVTAPLVAVAIGNTVLHFYKGDVLPKGVSEGSLENLKSLNFVVEGEVEGEVEVAEVAPSPSPYDDLKGDDLKAEIAKRNDGRDDDAKVSDKGNKADLIAALVADDSE